MSILNIWAKFNGTLLSTVPGLSVLAIDSYKQPKRTLSMSSIARTDKRSINSAFYTEKIVTVTVCIQRLSRELVEQSVDTMMSMLQGKDKELWVPQSTDDRKYYVTLSDVNVTQGGTAYWEADLIFACSDSFGYDTEYTSVVNLTGVTASSRSDQYSWGGSAPTQAPYIQVYYTAISGGTGAAVVIGNGSTGQQITVTRNWVTGDRLEVDCMNQTVKVNGAEVEFTGAFPVFDNETTASITYSDNFSTSRTFNYLVYYYKRYS